MKASFIYRQSTPSEGPFAEDIQAENPEQNVRAMAEHKVMEWEAEQGPNFQPLNDSEREEMIQDYMEEMGEGRNKIKETLNEDNLDKAA